MFPLIPTPPLAVARYLILLEPVTTREAVNENDPSTIPFGWLNDVPDDPAVSKGHRLLRSYFQITAASNLADQNASSCTNVINRIKLQIMVVPREFMVSRGDYLPLH